MASIIDIVSNIITILSFPATIFFVVRELRKNNEIIKKNNQEIKTLTQTIINQQDMSIGGNFVNNGRIDSLNIKGK